MRPSAAATDLEARASKGETMTVEQSLKERLLERIIDFLPSTLKSELENASNNPENVINIFFDAFFQAAMIEMVDKYEIQNILDNPEKLKEPM